uniref:5-demethoxyubiquinone hydroxylase, mitochondrial n=1 Tax=Panagrolaimus sp. JU765 TaxID=591449 RepID=A0AC34QPD7_9BILA
MGKTFRSFSEVWENNSGRRAILASGVCILCFLYLLYVVAETRSLVLTGVAWLTIFSFFAVFSTVLSIGISGHPSGKYSYGFVRVPVLAVFTTTVVAQLSAVIQLKEAVESLFASDHHHGPGHGVASGHTINHHFYSASLASSIALLLAAYNVSNQPFQYVLTAAKSSSLQEHAIDISNAICSIFPGMSRFLLPRINAMSLLAFVSTVCCVLTHWFMTDFEWFDSVATMVLSAATFTTMFPLTHYTGMILLQTTPSHVHSQIDRCISEAATVDGVLELKNSHFWQLDFNQIAGTVDVRIRRDADEQIVLSLVTEKLCSVIGNLSIQVVKDSGWSEQPSYVPQIPTGAYLGGLGHSSYGHEHHDHDHHHSPEEKMFRSVVRCAINHNLPRQKLIEKVVRVDHAGELGADRIYAGQMAVLQGSSVADIIKGMWDEEKEHLDTMERLCAKHEVPPTRFAPVFSVGTALLGKEGAMACTIAVEELIGRHYNDQIKELINDDPQVHKDLLKTLTRLRDEELHHHDTGIAHDGLKAPMYDLLKSVIQTGCKGAIWIAEKV